MKRAWIALLFATALCAQTPKFEVASLKLVPAGTRFTPPSGGPGTSDPEHFTWQTTALCALIGRAYDVACDQITGPDWMNAQLASVSANIPANTTPEQFAAMLQSLFADRLHLAIHRESKTIEGYDLVVAKSGTKLKELPASDPTPANAGSRGQFGQDGATVTYPRASMQFFASDLVFRLRQMAGPPEPGRILRVVDKTGLTGTYAITLHYVPASMQDVPGPDLFAALESQLGVKLEAVKITLDMIVIDHIDRTPAEN